MENNKVLEDFGEEAIWNRYRNIKFSKNISNILSQEKKDWPKCSFIIIVCYVNIMYTFTLDGGMPAIDMG